MDREIEFTEYAAARWSLLVRSMMLLGASPHDAEDAVQSALERCFLHWDRVRNADDRDAYVHRVLVNTSRSLRRPRMASEVPVAEPRQDRATQVERIGAEEVALMWRMLARLTDSHREALVLRFYVDLSEHQMATALGISPGTVKSRISRGLAALAKDPDLADVWEDR